MLYRPSPSLVTLRTFSISAGLDASMVAPGRTAPDESFTSPAIPLACCAQAVDASSTIATAPASRSRQLLRTMAPPSDPKYIRRPEHPPRFPCDAADLSSLICGNDEPNG